MTTNVISFDLHRFLKHLQETRLCDRETLVFYLHFMNTSLQEESLGDLWATSGGTAWGALFPPIQLTLSWSLLIRPSVLLSSCRDKGFLWPLTCHYYSVLERQWEKSKVRISGELPPPSFILPQTTYVHFLHPLF